MLLKLRSAGKTGEKRADATLETLQLTPGAFRQRQSEAAFMGIIFFKMTYEILFSVYKYAKQTNKQTRIRTKA